MSLATGTSSDTINSIFVPEPSRTAVFVPDATFSSDGDARAIAMASAQNRVKHTPGAANAMAWSAVRHAEGVPPMPHEKPQVLQPLASDSAAGGAGGAAATQHSAAGVIIQPLRECVNRVGSGDLQIAPSFEPVAMRVAFGQYIARKRVAVPR